MNKYIEQFSMLSVAKLLRIPLAVFISALMSRAIGPEGIGKWSMIVAVAAFFQSVLVGWTQAQAVRLGRSEWLDSGRLSNTWSARQRFVFAGLLVSAVLLALRPYSFFELLTELPSSWWMLALAYLLATWWMTESQILLQTTGKFVLLSALPLVVDLSIVSFLLAILFAFQGPDPAVVIVGIVTITALIGGASWVTEFIATRSWGGQAATEDVATVVSYGGPFALAALMGYLSDWGDHFLLQYFHGPHQVGLFQAGYQAMIAMIAIAAPISVVFLPKLIDQSRMDPESGATYALRTVPVTATIWLLMLIPCIAIVPWLFGAVFGDAFRGARHGFLLLCISVPGAVFSYLYSVLFNIQGRSGRIAFYIGLMTLVNFIFSIALIPGLGNAGAAIGTAVSYVLIQALCMFDQHKFLAVNACAPASLLLVGVAYGILQCVIGENLVLRIALAAVCVGLVIVVARFFRIFQANTFTGLLPRRFAPISAILTRVLTSGG